MAKHVENSKAWPTKVTKDTLKDWGPFVIQKLKNAQEYWAINDEILNDDDGFKHNRLSLLQHFKDDQMYGLFICENDFMFRERVYDNNILARDRFGREGGFYMLPCFCAVDDDNVAQFIWVHSRCQRLGFGTRMVNLLDITQAQRIMPSSEAFWTSCGVEVLSRA